MSGQARTRTAERIDELMERAGLALSSTRYFECEALAQEALELAFRAGDHDRMSRILMPLEEARRQIRMLAADAGVAGRLDEIPEEGFELKPGCWLIEPTLVGADGRELRRQAAEQEIPVIVMVREPLTQLGKWPVVMVGPSTTRAYVDPPKKEPDVEWFLDAGEALGDAAIESVDPAAPLTNQINALFDALCTIRDHDKLHQALATACVKAMHEEAPPSRKAG